MNQDRQECIIQLSQDGQTLEIINKKFKMNPKYNYEKTPDII